MEKNFDFKKEWPKIKKEIFKVSQEAVKLAKKGEKEIVKLSYKGKIQMDISALGFKKEHLFYLIGKEYVRAYSSGKMTTTLKKLVEEVAGIDKQVAQLKKKLSARQAQKRKAAVKPKKK